MPQQSKKILFYPSTQNNNYVNYTPLKCNFEEFNQIIGLPKHPAQNKEMPLMPYQKAFFEITKTSKHRKFHVNKARQIGMTETIIRILLFYAITKYAPGKIIIMAGTRLDTTRDIFARLKELTVNIPDQVLESGPNRILLRTGVEIIGLPANPEAITGLTKIRAVFLDEAAKWELKDDYPVINAVLPIVRSNQSDLFMISTPKGLRGFFYHIDIGQNDFLKIKYDIFQVQGLLYSKEQIEQMINSSVEDPNQEYLCQYVAGRNTIFGSEFATGDHEIGW